MSRSYNLKAAVRLGDKKEETYQEKIAGNSRYITAQSAGKGPEVTGLE
jgi:hypothetical protein